MSSATGIDPTAALWVAVALGLGTLALRVGFADLRRRWALPERVEAALDWVPVAALAAMVLPTFGPTASGAWDTVGLAAGAITGWIAYRTKNLLLAVVAGLLVAGSLAWLVG